MPRTCCLFLCEALNDSEPFCTGVRPRPFASCRPRHCKTSSRAAAFGRACRRFEPPLRVDQPTCAFRRRRGRRFATASQNCGLRPSARAVARSPGVVLGVTVLDRTRKSEHWRGARRAMFGDPSPPDFSTPHRTALPCSSGAEVFSRDSCDPVGATCASPHGRPCSACRSRLR